MIPLGTLRTRPPPPALADDKRARLSEERRALAKEREERDARFEQQRVEQQTVAATKRAEQMAGDLRHDVDDARRRMVGMILAASAKARGEIASEPALPENLMARAIILSGRRRTEALSAADEAWLNSYLAKIEHARR
jgi:hypothetical protein